MSQWAPLNQKIKWNDAGFGGMRRAETNKDALQNIEEAFAKNTDVSFLRSTPDPWAHLTNASLLLLGKNPSSLTEPEKQALEDWRVTFASIFFFAESLGLACERVLPTDDNGKSTTINNDLADSLFQFLAYRENRGKLVDASQRTDELKEIRKKATPDGALYGGSWGTIVRWVKRSEGVLPINVAISSPDVVIVPAPNGLAWLEEQLESQCSWFGPEGFKECGATSAGVPQMSDAQALDLAQFLNDYARYIGSLNGMRDGFLDDDCPAKQSVDLLNQYKKDLVNAYGLGTLPQEVYTGFADRILVDIRKPKETIFQPNFYYLDITKTADRVRYSEQYTMETRSVERIDGDATQPKFFGLVPFHPKSFLAAGGDNPPEIKKIHCIYDCTCEYDIDIKHTFKKAVATKVDVTITLSRQGKEYTLRKVYDREHLVKLANSPDRMPFASIWGDLDGLAEYALACSYPGQLDSCRIQRFVPPGSCTPTTTGRLDDQLGDGRIDRYKLSAFPPFLCAQTDAGETVGLLLLQKSAVQISKNGGVWHLAIDLGTSSTAVLAGPSNAMKSLTEHQTCWSVPGFLVQHDTFSRLDFSHVFSIPANPSKFPFATRMFVPDQPNNKWNILENSVAVLFLAKNTSANEANLRLASGLTTQAQQYELRVKSSFKWNGSEDGEKACVRMLYEEMILIAALQACKSGASSLQLRYSFPTAFNKSARDTLKETIEDAMQRANRRFAGESFVALKDSRSEGDAARKAANLELPFLLIDIGGGSTDLFIGINSKDSGVGEVKYFDGSVKFASHDIFLRLLRNLSLFRRPADTADKGNFSSDFMGYLKEMSADDQLLSVAETWLQSLGDKSWDSFVSNMEDYLPHWVQVKKDGETLGTTFGKLLSERVQNPPQTTIDKAAFRNFVTCLSVSISSLLYYAGMMLRGSTLEHTNFTVAFSGNGSKLLDWLFFAQSSALQDTFAQFCGAIFTAGFCPNDPSTSLTVRFNKIENPKELTVQGFSKIVEEANTQSQRDESGSINFPYCSGEHWTEPKTKAEYDHFLAVEQSDPQKVCPNQLRPELTSSLSREDVQDHNFVHFISVYNRAVDTLNYEISMFNTENAGYCPRKITFNPSDVSPDFVGPLDKEMWKTKCYQGDAHGSLANDEYPLYGYNDSKHISEQTFFFIEIKALLGMMFASFLPNPKAQPNRAIEQPQKPPEQPKQTDSPPEPPPSSTKHDSEPPAESAPTEPGEQSDSADEASDQTDPTETNEAPSQPQNEEPKDNTSFSNESDIFGEW